MRPPKHTIKIVGSFTEDRINQERARQHAHNVVEAVLAKAGKTPLATITFPSPEKGTKKKP
jgi:hypothetical protein